MHYEYIVACCDEARFCAKQYGGDSYWQNLKIEDAGLWYDCYQMGGEL